MNSLFDQIQNVWLPILAATIILILLGWYFADAIGKMAKKEDEAHEPPPADNDERKRAVSVTPFSNPITLGILLTCIGLIVLGIAIIVSGNFLGMIIAGLGVLAWWAGDTKHSDDPIEAGIVKIWGKYITLNGKTVAVGGRTVLADYFPFFIGTTKIDISNKNMEFEMKVLSSDNVTMPLELSVTGFPDIDDAIDYIRAGGDFKEIQEQIDDIVYERVKLVARGYTMKELAANSNLVSKELDPVLHEIFQTKSFGWKFFKLNCQISMPEDIEQTMNDRAKELLERENETLEYETDVMAAITLHKKHKEAGETVTLEKCIETIKDLRLIRDKRYAKIDGKGVILTDQSLNMGGGDSNNQKKKKG